MQLNFHRQGQQTSANSIVLLHGLLGSWENLKQIAQSLSDHFDVICVDLPNHGKSPHCDDCNYQQMANQVSQLMDNLDIEKYNLLGHSMGGKVAMQLAIDKPEKITKMIVVDVAPVAYEPRHGHIFDALTSLDLDTLANRKAADTFLQPLIPETGIRQFLLKGLVKQDNRFIWRFNLEALVSNYKNISQGIIGNGSYLGPTLFVKGADSDYLLTEHRPHIIRHFPNCKARIVQGAGHWVHAEKPEQFSRLVNDFLSASIEP